jgi:hypothetical protein
VVIRDMDCTAKLTVQGMTDSLKILLCICLSMSVRQIKAHLLK